MRIELDKGLCQCYGNCQLAAPEVFDLGASDTVVKVLQSNPPEHLREAVEEAVRVCPVEALTLHDD